MNNWRRFVRARHARASVDEILRAPVDALQGVSGAAGDALAASPLLVHTVFDLATSRFFNAARIAVAQSREPDSHFAESGLISSSIFDPSFDPGDTEIARHPVTVLFGIGPQTASRLSADVGIPNLHGMAFWAPFIAAREMLERKRSGDRQHIDPGVPPELVPQYNYYVTENTHFRVFSADPAAGTLTTGNREDLANAPIKLATDCSGHVRRRPKVGAVLQFEQSWLPTGLTLGSLQYALGLAPGESTRVAIIDWSRTDSATSTESIDEASTLTNELIHARAISEVSSAMALQAQSGFSSVTSDSEASASASSGFGVNNLAVASATAAAGATAGGGIGAVIGGSAGVVIGAVAGSAGYGIGTVPGAIVGGVAGALGGGLVGGAVGGTAGFLATAEFGSTQLSSSSNRLSTVTASTTSAGRALTASMAQNISDNTQQVASTVRNRRASIVQEISQRETTDIQTRVVANYNHMHALTVQYFEVLQTNEVTTSVNAADRCLYVPFEPIDDWNDGVREKYLAYLLNAALIVDIVFGLLFDQGTTVMQSGAVARLPADAVEEENLRRGDDMTAVNAEFDRPVASRYLDPWIFEEPLRLGSLAVYGIDNHGSTLHHERVEFRINFIDGRTRLIPGWILTAEAIESLPLVEEIRDISLTIEAREEALVPAGPITLRVGLSEPDGPNYPMVQRDLRLRDLSPFTEGLTVTVPVASFFNTPSEEWIDKHLALNADYYTRHILGSLDEIELSGLLRSYQFDGRPLTDLVEGAPLAISGNHLVFRYPFKPRARGTGPAVVSAEDQRARWLEAQGFALDPTGKLKPEVVTVDNVPMPTGGIFAEAVQGRANAAELIDLTRFWDWGSSPIGKTAPEIQSIREANRAVDLTATPGAFQSGLINIQNGAAVPAPQGQKALLSTLGSPGLFRNLAGLKEASALATATLKQSADAAIATGAQSSQNLTKGLEATSKVIEQVLTLAGDLGSSIASAGFSIAGGAIPKGSDQTSSVIGGLLNAGQALDHKRKQNRTSGTAGAQSPGAAGNASSGNSITLASSDGTASGLSFEEKAFVELVERVGGNPLTSGAGSSAGQNFGSTDNQAGTPASAGSQGGLRHLLSPVLMSMQVESSLSELEFVQTNSLEPAAHAGGVDSGWDYSISRTDDAKGLRIEALERRGMGDHAGHMMTVLDELVWHAPVIADPGLFGGQEISLNLSSEFQIAAGRSGAPFSLFDNNTAPFHRISLEVEQSSFIIFAHGIEADGTVKPLSSSDVGSSNFMDRLNPLSDPGLQNISPGATVVITAVELVVCRPASDFDPFGGAITARFFPLISCWSSKPLSALACNIELNRPIRSDFMQGGLDNNRIFVSFYTDRNYDDPASPLDLLNWTGIFDHYRLDSAGTQGFNAIGTKPERSLDNVRMLLGHDPVQHEIATVVKKLHRQGTFDNVHIAPAMVYQDNGSSHPAFMAPICHHDCLHLHWRWSSGFRTRKVMGWSETGPYTKFGAPMIPLNQRLDITPSAGGKVGITYRASAHSVSALSDTRELKDRWQVFFHHGAAQALKVNVPIPESMMDHLYYSMRFDQRHNDTGSPVPRIDESRFDTIESL